LLTSPHITAMNERVQIGLEPLSEQEFCNELTIFMRQVYESDIELTYAEILYAFGFWVFARKQVEYMIIEVGLGGLLDATNIMTRADKVSVITDIGFDHVRVLGNTLESITAQKAGIIGVNNAVFCYHQSHVVDEGIEQVARRKQADLYTIHSTYDEAFHFLPLFQQRNATLALAAVQYVMRRDGNPELTDNQVQIGAMIRIPGRMEVLHIGTKTVILDGAHNPQKLTTLFESIEVLYPGKPVAALVGFLDNKSRDTEALIITIKGSVRHIIATTFPAAIHGWHGSRSADELREALVAAEAPSYDVVPVLPIAVSQLLKREEPVLVITGSFYMLHIAAQRLSQI